MEKNKKVVEKVMREARRRLGKSRPGSWYSPSGDCLFYFKESVPSEAVIIGKLVTIYEALDDRRIVGIQVDGLHQEQRNSREG